MGSSVPKRGETIDRYELVEPIGEGGQGTVWKARDRLDGSVRALKLFPGSLVDQSFERARREAHALAKSPHPNLVACFGLFEDVARGFVGVVLELVDGQPLQIATGDPRMTADHRSALLVQLAEALAHVHSSEIVHRDLKPENVLVTDAFWKQPGARGTIKLVDFGIAIRLGNPRPLTNAGAIVGTAPYLAPEVIDPRSSNPDATGFARDLFAYGVLAYELLTGVFPTGLAVDASTVEMAAAYMRARRGDVPWPPAGLPARWQQAIAACLAIEPSRRPVSGVALLEILRERGSLPYVKTVEAAASDPGVRTEMGAPLPTPRFEAPTVRASYASLKAQAAASRGDRARSSSSSWMIIPALVAVAAIAVIAFRLRATPHDAEPSSPASVVVMAQPPDSHTAAPPSICPLATCCGGAACAPRADNAKACASPGPRCRACASGRSCIPEACESQIDPQASWLLRVAAINAGGKEIVPRPKICLRRAAGTNPPEPWTCTPAGKVNMKATRLLISTEELHHRGIDVLLDTEAEGVQSSGVNIKHAQIGVAALCIGLNFRWTGEDGTPYAATLFLDDATDDATIAPTNPER